MTDDKSHTTKSRPDRTSPPRRHRICLPLDGTPATGGDNHLSDPALDQNRRGAAA